MGVTVASAPPAQAFVGPPPIVIGAAADTLVTAGGALCSTGVGCVISIAGALAVGGWWAYNNQDTIANWWGSLFGDGTQTAEGLATGAGQSIQVAVTSSHVVSITGRTGNYPKVAFYLDCIYLSGTVIPSTTTWTGNVSTPNGTVIFDLGAWEQTQCKNVGGRVSRIRISGTSSSSLTQPIVVNDSTLLWQYEGTFGTIQTQAQVTCRDAAGATSTITGNIADRVIAMMAENATPVPACPGGSRTTNINIYERPVAPEGSHPPMDDFKKAISWAVNEANLQAKYPACAGVTPCTLVLKYKGDTCVPGSGTAGCSDWWSKRLTNAEDYQCLWGPYMVPVSRCQPLRDWFKSNPTLDANGYPAGSLTDPVTGENGGDQTSQYTGPRAPTGTETLPGPATADAPVDADCGLGWSALLDGTIVYKAVSCALAWAFVPDSAVVTQAQTDVSAALDSTGLSAWTSAVGGVGTALVGVASSAGSGCGGLHFVLPLGGHDYPVDILDSCGPPLADVAPKVKLVLTVVFLVAGARLVVRPILSSFGMHGSGV
jgi:hypothetical protein